MSEPLTAEPALPPAPGADDYLALDFVNSAIALPGGHFVDLLGTPGATNRWLTERGLAPEDAGVQEMCAAQLRSLREHLRVLFAARSGGLPALPAALSAVNDALSRAPSAALLYWDERRGPYRAAPCPTNEILDRALATIAANAADLLTGPDADRLTPCGSTPCNRYLLRHGRRHWCSVRCGDRARAARAYARRTHPKAD
ncbi:CGNR zinc finger domain-containing protein [Nonomuraea roseoviolacea subsp. roseoviolacea]|uniref:RNA-binding Zn ribbon-like protein n=1 Tax=Nonomuraea roseoviolacea subsp. carminata TaxID=160689 RepID=A0ABT1KAH2_9ACTN|nr:ABATE domain-containing protein [Nonomuraea roseoviolacea]MCP2351000.1 putative RNA-binding Zn ribbon-like protein [Nonomuraea roseoviolacea subsp. carminata]